MRIHKSSVCHLKRSRDPKSTKERLLRTLLVVKKKLALNGRRRREPLSGTAGKDTENLKKSYEAFLDICALSKVNLFCRTRSKVQRVFAVLV